MPHQGLAAAILEQWREVDRELQAIAADSPELASLRAEADRLRDEYQRLIRAAQGANWLEPPTAR